MLIWRWVGMNNIFTETVYTGRLICLVLLSALGITINCHSNLFALFHRNISCISKSSNKYHPTVWQRLWTSPRSSHVKRFINGSRRVGRDGQLDQPVRRYGPNRRAIHVDTVNSKRAFLECLAIPTDIAGGRPSVNGVKRGLEGLLTVHLRMLLRGLWRLKPKHLRKM